MKKFSKKQYTLFWGSFFQIWAKMNRPPHAKNQKTMEPILRKVFNRQTNGWTKLQGHLVKYRKLGNLSTGKGIERAGSGNHLKKGKGIVRAGYGNQVQNKMHF